MTICTRQTRNTPLTSSLRACARLLAFSKKWHNKEERPAMSNIPAIPYLDEHRGEAQALLEQLCSQPSIASQHIGIAEMSHMVEALLRENGFRTQFLTVPDAPPVVYGELRGSSPFTLLLYNHYDVQPAEPLELWQS